MTTDSRAGCFGGGPPRPLNTIDWGTSEQVDRIITANPSPGSRSEKEDNDNIL